MIKPRVAPEKPDTLLAWRLNVRFILKGYKMKKAKSFNGLVFEIASHRLNLKRREKIVFQRLLGFLIRNDKPFPYSRKALSQLTGYSHRSLDESLNCLERLRLINRIGYTNRVRFVKGVILQRICSLITKRIQISENFFNKDEILKKRRNDFSKRYAVTFMKLLNRDGNKCNYCNKVTRLTIDHICPVSKGGEDCLTNLQLLCQSCNSSKSDKL